MGNTILLDDSTDAVWIAVESVGEQGMQSKAEAVAIDWEKGKCHRAIIRAIGTRDEATNWLVKHGCTKVVYANHLVGDHQFATVGHYGAAFAGTDSVAIGGKRASATVAENGIAITQMRGESKGHGHHTIAISNYSGHAAVEDRSIAIAGDFGAATAQQNSIAITNELGEATVGMESIAIVAQGGKATSGAIGISIGAKSSQATTGNDGLAATSNFGTSVAGNGGIASTGYSGRATSGDHGTSITGSIGLACTGENGVAIANDAGFVRGGKNSVLILYNNRGKPIVAIVGENGIKPDTLYTLHDSEDRFVETLPR